MVGIAKRIWPQLGLVYTITSGSFAHYGKILQDTYFKGRKYHCFLVTWKVHIIIWDKYLVRVIRPVWSNCQFFISFWYVRKIKTESDYQRVLTDIPFYGAFYIATEGWLGINIWPNRYPSVWLLSPYKVFFEFIPMADIHEEQPSVLFMDEVSRETSILAT